MRDTHSLPRNLPIRRTRSPPAGVRLGQNHEVIGRTCLVHSLRPICLLNVCHCMGNGDLWQEKEKGIFLAVS
jgi:hypothetical protein